MMFLHFEALEYVGTRESYEDTDLHSPFLISYLIASMGLQVLWSFGLACLDFYALRRDRDLKNPVLVSLFVVGDWVFYLLLNFKPFFIIFFCVMKNIVYR